MRLSPAKMMALVTRVASEYSGDLLRVKEGQARIDGQLQQLQISSRNLPVLTPVTRLSKSVLARKQRLIALLKDLKKVPELKKRAMGVRDNLSDTLALVDAIEENLPSHLQYHRNI